jgi:hypothetical protein
MKSQLPPRPSLENLKNQAKRVLKGHQAADPDTLKHIQEHHPRWGKASPATIQNSHFTLSDAQLVIANEYGFETWSKLKSHVLLHQADPSTDGAVKTLREAAGRGDLQRLGEMLDANPSLIDERGGPGTRTAAQRCFRPTGRRGEVSPRSRGQPKHTLRGRLCVPPALCCREASFSHHSAANRAWR